MAFNNLGYRKWSGALESDLTRWCVITSTGVIRAWQSRWLRRLLITIWFPAVFFSIAFFTWEQAIDNPEIMNRRGAARVFFGPMLDRIGDERISLDDPEGSRAAVWAWLLSTFMRYPQLVILVLMVGMIAPPLISQDLRSRAFLLYFSRPLNRFEYVLGKQGTLWCYLALISVVPGLAMYVVGVMLSPSFDVVTATWDLPFRVIGAAGIMMLPTASVALCLSSMTQQSRYAGFAWFAMWIIGWSTYVIMSGVEAWRLQDATAINESWWALASPYHLLDRAQSWVFGLSSFEAARSALITLAVVTVVANIIILRRVAAPMRA